MATNQDTGLRQRAKVAPTDDTRPANATKDEHEQMALATHAACCAKSVQAVMLAVFIDAMGLSVLKPNFPRMVRQIEDPENFPVDSVLPDIIDPATAFYCLTGAGQLGAFFASLVIAPLSDKVGRKACMMACMWGGVVCALLKWLARKDFLLFLGASFLNGCFGASMTVGMAYLMDVYSDPAETKKKMAAMGAMQGLYMLGMTAGGIFAILTASQSIFMPLWVIMALNLLAALNLRKAMVNVKKKTKPNDGKSGVPGNSAEKDDALDKRTMWHIIAGSFVDNLGSTGCQMAVSPVMVTAFMVATPSLASSSIPGPLSQTGYQVVVVCTSFSVIFGIKAAMPTFKKYGTAGGCVIGNALTAVVLAILILIAGPALDGKDRSLYMGIYLAVYFLGFPLTVISQISTGPMLSAIAPPSRRGYVNGMNSAVMQIGMSLGALGIAKLGDATDLQTMMWTCVALSLLAAVVNYPLTKHPKMCAPKPKPKAEHHEGAEGKPHWISAESQHELNMKAMAETGKLPYHRGSSYDDDKNYLDTLGIRAHSDFKHIQNIYAKLYSEIQDPAACEKYVAGFNSARTSPENQKQAREDLGKWFTDYLEDNGYWAENQQTMYKQMIVSAFPPLVKKGEPVTVDNFENLILRFIKIMRMHVKIEEDFDFHHHHSTAQATAAFLANRH